jgi:hypothetical protein
MAADQPASIRLALDSADFQADAVLLAQAAERSAQLRSRLVDLGFYFALEQGDLSAHIRVVQADAGAAAAAGDVLLRLEFAQGVAGLLAAVRAGEFGSD